MKRIFFATLATIALIFGTVATATAANLFLIDRGTDFSSGSATFREEVVVYSVNGDIKKILVADLEAAGVNVYNGNQVSKFLRNFEGASSESTFKQFGGGSEKTFQNAGADGVVGTADDVFSETDRW